MDAFETESGDEVPAVTADEMRAVDEVAVEETGPPLLSMMENAGRSLALEVQDALPAGTDDGESAGPVAVLAGGGGNGGGGLACARHLSNHGHEVRVVLDRPPADLSGAPATHWGTLDAAAAPTVDPETALDGAALAVDAVLGYGLSGAPRGRAEAAVTALGSFDGPVVSLDVPSGVDATTGDRPGVAVAPDRTLTLALPKTGLATVDEPVALADIGIPAVVFERAGVDYDSPFDGAYRVRFRRR
jgi:NAD(P)H-hydrate epimerase